MVQLYLDEDIDVLLARLLAHRGFDVTTALERQMLRKSDEEQLQLATQINAVIVTHNRGHFERLFANYIEQGKMFPGIIVARQRNVFDLAERLIRFFRQHKDIHAQLWYL